MRNHYRIFDHEWTLWATRTPRPYGVKLPNGNIVGFEYALDAAKFAASRLGARVDATQQIVQRTYRDTD